MNELDLIQKYIPKIKPNTRYWFLRTDGGSMYDLFYKNNKIAIGYPSIHLRDIQSCIGKDDGLKVLKEQVEKKYPEHQMPGLVASQLLKFVGQIQAGDYVVIPSRESKMISIGQVRKTETFIDRYFGAELIPEFRKQKKVKWLKTAFKTRLDPNLLGMLSNHQTLSDATPYADWINSLLFDYYQRKDENHLVLRIRKDQAINARELFQSCLNLLDLTDSLCQYTELDEDTSDIHAKISLNSPGHIELVGKIGVVLFLIGVVIVGLSGGGFKFKFDKIGLEGEIRTDGFIKKVEHFLNERENREMKHVLSQKLDGLEMKDPEHILKILKEIDKEK